MEIKDFLAPSQVMVDLRASDKARLLDELARRAAAALHLAPEVISSALLKREALGSTGTGGGVAVPHARLPGVKKPFGMLVRLAKAVDFDAIDGAPVDIVFLLLMPENSKDPQLNALACVARALRDVRIVESLRRAKNSAEVYQAVVAKDKR